MAMSNSNMRGILTLLAVIPVGVFAYQWWQLSPLDLPEPVVKTRTIAQASLRVVAPIEPQTLSPLPRKPGYERHALGAADEQGVKATDVDEPGDVQDVSNDAAGSESAVTPSSVTLAPQVSEESLGKPVSSQSTQISQASERSDLSLNEIDLSSLPDDLAYQVQAALSDHSSAPQPQSASAGEEGESVSQLDIERSQWRGKLPAMDFQTHIYSSRNDKRWVRVNGEEHHQGDEIADGVRLEAIRPQSVIVSFEQQRIEIPALFDWQG